MWIYDRETLAFLLVNDAAIEHYSSSLDEFLTRYITKHYKICFLHTLDTMLSNKRTEAAFAEEVRI